MRPTAVLLLVFLCAAAVRPASPADEPVAALPPLTLDEVTAAIRDGHPLLEAGRARVEVSQARAAGAAAWEDPMVGIEIMREGTTDPFDPAAFEWMIEQKLPLSRRNRLAARVAESQTGVARADLAAREVALVAEAKIAYFQLAGAGRQLELNRAHQDLVRQFIDIARNRFEVGAEPQATLLLAEADLAELEEQALALASACEALWTRLNTLMNRTPDRPLGRALLPENIAALPAPHSLQALAEKNHPAIAAAEAEFETGNARLALAKRNTFPDPVLRIEARTRDGGGRIINDYDTAIVFNLPWLNPRRTRNEVLEAGQDLRAARAELEAARLQTAGALLAQWQRLEARRRRIALTRDRLLPLARQNIDAMRLAYETGNASFLGLVSVRRSATEIESSYIADLAAYHSGLARLEQLAGGALSPR
ncbi:MAG: TolC family protein [Opitutaceae bacterium]